MDREYLIQEFNEIKTLYLNFDAVMNKDGHITNSTNDTVKHLYIVGLRLMHKTSCLPVACDTTIYMKYDMLRNLTSVVEGIQKELLRRNLNVSIMIRETVKRVD